MLETLPDTVQPESGSRTENAHETHKDLEIMELKHELLQKENALIQKETEALRMALKISGRFTWTWFLLSLLLLATLLYILSYLYWYS
ncbi:MAG: hypothetical protein OXN19_16165 [Caldilineaceae bacterium]|nr:hypothetical protein [Caldilineaceae bacterium]